jgi:hypothetical protein
MALLKGQRMVCVAQVGDLVPVGTPVDTDAGLTGACVHAGEPLYCNDSKTDLRVNGDVCLKMGIRSVLVMPIKNNCSESVGILEVVSSQAEAFDRIHIDSLKVLARRCSAHAEQIRENRPPNEKPSIEYDARHKKLRTANYQDCDEQLFEIPSLNTYARSDSLGTTQKRRQAETIITTDVERIIDRMSASTSCMMSVARSMVITPSQLILNIASPI